jgi:WD40 repeat protein
MLLRLAPVLAVCALTCWLPSGATQPPVQPRLDALGDPLPEGASGRIGTLRFRHGGKTLLGFSADRKSVLFHSSGAIHSMNVADGSMTKVVRYQDAPADDNGTIQAVQDIAVSGDGTLLAQLDRSTNDIGIVDIRAGKQTRQIKLTEVLKAGANTNAVHLQLSHNGKALLIVSNRGPDDAPLVWVDTTTGQALHAIAPAKNSAWLQAKFTPDGKHVLALGSDSRLQVLDAGNGKELRSVKLDDKFNNFSFQPCSDGKSLLTWASEDFKGGDPPGVRLLDYSDDKQLKQVHKLGDFDSSSTLVMTTDTKYLFLRGQNAISQVELATGKSIQQFDLPSAENNDRVGRGFAPSTQAGAYGHGLAVSADGKLLAASGKKAVFLYDVATGKQLNPAVTGDGIAVVRFTPDGKSLAIGMPNLQTSFWDFKETKVRYKLALPANFAPQQRSRDFLLSLFATLALSHDGKLAVMSVEETGVHVWDAVTGKYLHHMGGDQGNNRDGPGSAVAFAPRGNLLASGHGDGVVRLWDAAAGKELRSWAWHNAKPDMLGARNEAYLLALAFSPDGKMLAGFGFSGFERKVQIYIVVWETATGQERLRVRNVSEMSMRNEFESIFFLLDQLAMTLTFSPDGKTLAMGTITSLHLIDAATGKDLRTYSGRACLGKTAVFSKDGSVLFVGRFDGGIRVMETTTGKVLRDLPGHLEPVLSLSVSPDGKTLASGSADATVLLWDVAEIGKPVAVAKAVLVPKDLDACWADLAGNDAGKAFQAILKMSAAPKETVPYLAQHLQPVPLQRSGPPQVPNARESNTGNRQTRRYGHAGTAEASGRQAVAGNASSHGKTAGQAPQRCPVAANAADRPGRGSAGTPRHTGGVDDAARAGQGRRRPSLDGGGARRHQSIDGEIAAANDLLQLGGLRLGRRLEQPFQRVGEHIPGRLIGRFQWRRHIDLRLQEQRHGS